MKVEEELSRSTKKGLKEKWEKGSEEQGREEAQHTSYTSMKISSSNRNRHIVLRIYKFVIKKRGRKSIHYFAGQKYPGHHPLATNGQK